MTIALLRLNPLPMDSSSMEPDAFMVATHLALATLIAATIEHSEMVRRRITIRADAGPVAGPSAPCAAADLGLGDTFDLPNAASIHP